MRKQKMKSFIWGFVIIFILSSFFTIVLLNLITKFCYLDSDYVIIISIIVGIIIGILGGIYSLIRLMETKMSYFNYWIDHHWPNLLLLYFITIIILASIKTSIIWSVDDIKNIITLEWNIFGIAIAIFLFWYIFIEKYIRDSKPIKRNTNGPIEILSYINEKSNFQQSVDLLFMSVIIITINMFMLLTSTAMVFISTPNNINLFI